MFGRVLITLLLISYVRFPMRSIININKSDSLVSDFLDFIYGNVVFVVCVKGELSGPRLFPVTETHLTRMKNALFFT